ncbi:ATP12-domain-containing protein [Thozetella sp. PMI_491]|nr:ATP12-domain-containing protein [Thozetella sp. PMI_491]
MKPPSKLHFTLPLRQLATAPQAAARAARPAVQQPLFLESTSRRTIHAAAARQAKVEPVYGIAPPPPPPNPSPEHIASRIARRKRQAELLRHATNARRANDAEKKGLKRRFWKDVFVKEVNGALEIHLDARPLRHPTTKEIIRVPLTKPHLAHALAIEWDQLTSAQEATKQHLVPLTSLICRAVDIAQDDLAHAASSPSPTSTAPIRASVTATLLRYLDTDSLLCWAPPADPNDPTRPESATDDDGHTLRELQERTAVPIVAYLTTRIWPGIDLRPVLDTGSIIPASQPEGVREVVQGWVQGLDAWELAGLERAVLAGKSMVGAARLVAEWSEGDAAGTAVSEQPAQEPTQVPAFGVEEAARAASIEVDWQTGRWGAVEDTHDVEREDLRRQLGSVVLLVSGTSNGKSKQ